MRRVVRVRRSTRALSWDEEATYNRALERLAVAQKELNAAWSIVQSFDRGIDRLATKANAAIASMKVYLKKKLRG